MMSAKFIWRPLHNRKEIRLRKIVLRQYENVWQAWQRVFPRHDFGTGRLRQDLPDRFDEMVEQLAREGNDRIPADRWDRISLDALQQQLNARRPTPQSTIEAVLHCVRECGAAALNDPANIERLRRCDEEARAQINERIAKLKDPSHVQGP
jgi:hypothetical protein